MKIAFAISESFPFAQTGGLGDIGYSLPAALKNLGCEIKVFLPKYSSIDTNKFKLNYCDEIGVLSIQVGENFFDVKVFSYLISKTNVEYYFIDCPNYFNRSSIYTNDPDEDERFILFSKSVFEVIKKLNWSPEIIHCNDWQTGLIPLYLNENYENDKTFENTATIFTIHNIAYQGQFPKETVKIANINSKLFFENSPIESWGKINFLKTGIMYSDIVNTVSPTYAKEITTSDYGCGLENSLLYRINDFYGILNGVDYEVWNPEKDKFIPFNYSKDDLNGKLKNKEFLLNKFNLEKKVNIPLIGIISRLVEQKGFDLFKPIIKELMQLDAQWIILGNGQKEYEDLFKDISSAFPDKVYTQIGYNAELSHLIEAGADIFLMPSRFEPCGLNQMYSLKYGTVPVVHNTGGLADTVQDWDEYFVKGLEIGTGFSFDDFNSIALLTTLKRAIYYYQNEKNVWHKIIQNGMAKDYSWISSANEYLKLYEKAKLKKKN